MSSRFKIVIPRSNTAPLFLDSNACNMDKKAAESITSAWQLNSINGGRSTGLLLWAFYWSSATFATAANVQGAHSGNYKTHRVQRVISHE